MLLAIGCGGGSPYPWNSFGYGEQPDGCVGVVGFTAGDAAPGELAVACTGGACECVADGESVGSFDDDALCEDWSQAMDGSEGRQDRMVGQAVELCGL
jgi:hypothetical protein